MAKEFFKKKDTENPQEKNGGRLLIRDVRQEESILVGFSRRRFLLYSARDNVLDWCYRDHKSIFWPSLLIYKVIDLLHL